MKGAPLVSVLMPVFNGRQYLPAAIRSVQRQTFDQWELVVVDDGSTDGSGDMARGLNDDRIRVVSNGERKGLVATLNRGLEEARGRWIARLDADDIAHSQRLSLQWEVAMANPSLPLVGSDALLISDRGRGAGRWRTGGDADAVRWDLCFRTPFAHSTAFFRRDHVLQRMGGYRERIASEDLDLWSRIGREYPIVTLRKPLVSYRQHRGSVMAEAKSKGAEQDDVRDCLYQNIRAAAPGLPDDDCQLVASTWAARIPDGEWRKYFASLANLRNSYLRARPLRSSIRRATAEHHFTLFCRISSNACRMRFLLALREWSSSDFLALPWPRICGVLVLSLTSKRGTP